MKRSIAFAVAVSVLVTTLMFVSQRNIVADGNPMPPPPPPFTADGNPMAPPPQSQWMIADGNPMPPPPPPKSGALSLTA